ncbi:fructosamine kinase family protein [Kamptonema sp. UHCC 0994]|uniref:fructosamine kinase family protein n=1 Tax=Kamptonema sp. UHCC 0994 TaxID=3031329 RepID=UPI0023BAF69D|nr:fructosamine kinase family protein [Kamptonema sp. UHCC 0994]MDF0556100.1 fructosamine kinase family protein [Kamptonema sp. UHCC 0994]
MWNNIATQITEVTREKFQIDNRRSVSGGCINQGYEISDGSRNYFVKLNQASQVAMFEAEALGLQQMWDSQTIRVPQPICWGTEGNSAYIVLEWLDLGGRGDNKTWEEMGRKLAAMHQYNPSSSTLLKGDFGGDINNTIGSTPQINTWMANWADFWAEHRIGYQLKLAKRRGGHFPQGERLLAVIPDLLASHKPQPSLVHGDLWGGNAGVTSTGEPVIFDPASYWGDREVDIAMTELFGGFSAAFYRGYNDVWPLEGGYERRKILYNLYHILNHFNLFGGSYESQSNQMINQLLR